MYPKRWCRTIKKYKSLSFCQQRQVPKVSFFYQLNFLFCVSVFTAAVWREKIWPLIVIYGMEHSLECSMPLILLLALGLQYLKALIMASWHWNSLSVLDYLCCFSGLQNWFALLQTFSFGTVVFSLLISAMFWYCSRNIFQLFCQNTWKITMNLCSNPSWSLKR